MKYLPCFMAMLVAANGLMACSDDADSSASGGAPSSAGTSAQAGSTTTGGQATGGSGSGTAGNPSTGGSAAAGMSAGGVATGGAAGGGTGGSSAMGGKDIVDTAVAAGSFTKLAEALQAAGLVDVLKGAGPFTVFAPTDAAFTAFEQANPGVLGKLSKDELGAILKYHVVAGAAVKSNELKDDQVFTTVNGAPVLVDLTGGVKVSDAKVTMPDVVASNGVIHVIDKIILPPTKDIVETAVAAGGFTQLAGALTSAGLVDSLKGPGPFTVFAPTDAAFGKLQAVPTGDALKNVLLYHVVTGAVGSGNLQATMVPTLLPNKSVNVTLMNGVQINDAKVTTANIIAKNGVIHVIDTVLVPN